jgi:UPF0755 protein
MKKRSCLPGLLLALAFLALVLLVAGFYVPMAAEDSFGPPSPALNSWQRFSFGLELTGHAGDLILPMDVYGAEQLFIIESGESVISISNRLEDAGLIANARTFRIYLVWTGMDGYIQTGMYRLSPALTAESIAGMLQTTTLTEVTFTVLPGWRMEEIAASLPTSGLNIPPEAFLMAAATPGLLGDIIPAGAAAEGFLYPDTYILPRTTTADQLVSILLQQFSLELTTDLRNGFANQGLSVYEAVTLASIIEREGMVDDELPTIASVFYNRLAIGMKLQTDPTVQYAIGYNHVQGTWWTNPLSAADLQFNSAYNTYLYPGLPPAPISNPGLAALTAVAFPAQTPYYFFQAQCDGSGLHNFSETFEQHEQNYCP